MRNTIVGVALVLVAAGACWMLGRPGTSVRSGGPVILISIDTLRADRLPLYGSTRIKTPHIDRLAADGVVFDNAYAHSPQTLPSHASILSGDLPFTHGVRDNIGYTVRADQRFLQHTLKERGYATAAFVSSYVLRRQTGVGSGFDAYDDELPPVSPDQPSGQVQRRGEDTVTRAIRWLDSQTSNNVFLFAHIYEPHTPYTPPERFAGHDPYDGEVAYSDEIIGALLDHLRQKDMYDAATIILLSDHGEGLGDHGETEHGLFLYRETTRVPLIVKLPGARGGGRRIALPVQHVDVMPTILELTGEREPAGRPGRSLLPVLLDGNSALQAANIYTESLSPRLHYGWSALYALSDDRYRYIRAPRDELYDLTQDPRELTSIAEGRPQVRAAMRTALEGMTTTTAAAPSAVSDEDRRKLAALGYVGTQTGSAVQQPDDKLPDPKDKIHVLQAYRRATQLLATRKFAEAAAMYQELLRDDPGMIDVRLRLGDAFERDGKTAEAIAAFRQVIERDPRNTAALTGVAGALLRTGRIEEAKAHVELAADAAPATAHEMLARIAVQQRDEAAARRHAKLAQEADPTLPMTAFIEGVILHGQGQFAGAAESFTVAKRAVATRTAQVADLNYYTADTFARLERYPEAEGLFKAELALFPAHARSHAGLAMLYRATGRTAESDNAVAQLTSRNPTREGYTLAAQLWTMFGEPGRAAAARAASPRLPR
ncbi:MAG TPA: sulfatase-like hydrolase/transferase [Vicinamibacterales bacterium]|nr:sulfatase-like hydrolase/transferase [Vicinamibacterales bacterium]